MNTFGNLIRQHRKNKRLPLRKVASSLGIDLSVLSKIERGERKASKELVIKSADFFDLDCKILLKKYFSDIVVELIITEENYKDILIECEKQISFSLNEYEKKKNI